MPDSSPSDPVHFEPSLSERHAPDQGSDDVHIASYIVQVRPEKKAALLEFIRSNPALECLAGGEAGSEDTQEMEGTEGKLVLVAEAPDQGRILDDMDALEQQPGVLACTLVYHEVMTRAEADHELIASDNKSHQGSAIITGIAP